MTLSIFLFTAALVMVVCALSVVFFRFVIPLLESSRQETPGSVDAEQASRSWSAETGDTAFLLDWRLWFLKAVPLTALIILVAMVPCLSYLADRDPESAEYFHKRTMLIQRLLSGDRSTDSTETQIKLAYHYEKKGQEEEALKEFLVVLDRLKADEGSLDRSTAREMSAKDNRIVSIRDHAARLAIKHEYYPVAADLFLDQAKLYQGYTQLMRSWRTDTKLEYLLSMFKAGDLKMLQKEYREADSVYTQARDQLQLPYYQEISLCSGEKREALLNAAIKALRSQERCQKIMGLAGGPPRDEADRLVKLYIWDRLKPEIERSWHFLAPRMINHPPYNAVVKAEVTEDGRVRAIEMAVGTMDRLNDHCCIRGLSFNLKKIHLDGLKEMSEYNIPIYFTVSYGTTGASTEVTPYQLESPYSYLGLR
ncbi:MAG: hypothetical protein AB7W16_14650 [Candidatus Obscuribacterales bacterium]